LVQRHTSALRPQVWMRLCYWWWFAAIGAFTPFASLYYREMGLEGIQIGVLTAMSSVGTAFLAPVWGAMADKYAVHKGLLGGLLLGGALGALLLARAGSFPHALLAVALLAACVSPVPSFLDSYAVQISERSGTSYGAMRVWGSIAYILATWSLGHLMGVEVSRLFIYCYAACLLLTMLSSWGLPRLREHAVHAMWSSFKRVLSKRALVVFLLLTYVIAAAMSTMYSFFGIYVREIGGTTAMLGTASSLAAISELPIIAGSGLLLRVLGPRRLLMIAVASYTVRLGVYGFLPYTHWVLGIQLIHGLCFGAYLVSTVTLAHRLAGRELAATAQAMLASISMGFGSITGSVMGGALLDALGTVGIYKLAAGMMLAALAALALSMHLLEEGEEAQATPAEAGEAAASPTGQP